MVPVSRSIAAVGMTWNDSPGPLSTRIGCPQVAPWFVERAM